MTEQRPERRARTVAWVGLGFQFALAIGFMLLYAWSQSESIRGLFLLSLVGMPIWVFLILIYHQRVLVQDESFETEQLKRERESGAAAIFDVEDEELLLAKRRLRWMYKWLLPVFTILVIAGLAAASLLRWRWTWAASLDDELVWQPVANADAVFYFVSAAALLSFFLSRYVIGMAHRDEWAMLRAGASYLMGITLAGLAVAISLGLVYMLDTPRPERVVAYGLRALLLLIAVEVLLNFVLDFYRPRAPDESPRPAFDSRVFGLFTEPGGIARSIAEAINYQFGFEVSSTWFYKLLQRSVGPLTGFAIITLLLGSSFVFVDSTEQAVVEHFGKMRGEPLGPGVHVKWPWPIDQAYKVSTAQVHQLQIGMKEEHATDHQEEDKKPELYLWTTAHSEEPHLEVLIATPKIAQFLTASDKANNGNKGTSTGKTEANTSGLASGGEAAPVSQLRVAMTLQYRILNAYDWVNTYADPERMLESIARRELMKGCANVEVKGLLGSDRARLERDLWKLVQSQADALTLGVEIVFLGIQGVHPPESIAKEFQEVTGAEQKKAAAINNAEADWKITLSEAAGHHELATQLSTAIRRLQTVQAKPDAAAEVDDAKATVERLFFGAADGETQGVGGRAAEIIAKSRARRWEHENEAHGQHVTFLKEIDVKNASPTVYVWRKYLEVLASSMDGIRKYLVASDGQYYLNLQDPMSAISELDLEAPEN